MTSDPIPETPDSVTDDWLTQALRQDGAIANSQVTGHTTALVEQQGATTVVARFGLTYDTDEPAAPRSLVGKFATPDEPFRLLMQGIGGYAQEIQFYQQFGDDAGMPTPHCYHASIDTAAGVFALLLEDMSASRVFDTGTSVEDVEVAIRHLAPFHAKWWDHPRLRTLEFLRYPGSPAHEALMRQLWGELAAGLTAVKERFGELVPDSLVALTEGLLSGFDAVLERAQRDEGRTTLVHGDYHPQQLFFESELGGRFAVFDWQTVNAGNGGNDLARMIVAGLDHAQREASDGRLIGLYHSLLLGHGVKDYSYQDCYDDFRRGLITSLVVGVIAASKVDPALIEAARASGALDDVKDPLSAAIDAHNVQEVFLT